MRRGNWIWLVLLGGVTLLATGCRSRPSMPAALSWAPPTPIFYETDVAVSTPVRDPHAISTRPPQSITAAPESFLDLTREQVIEIALQDSRILRELGGRIVDAPAATITAYDLALQRSDPFYGPEAALAEFDSVLSSSLTSANNDRVFNNAVLGGGAQELTQDALSLKSGGSRRLMNGAVVSLDRQLDYDSNNRSANLFPSAWESQVQVGIRQPLLQGAGKTFNSIAGPNAQPGFYFSNGIVIAQMNSQISELDFEKGLQDYLSEVEETYWGLQMAYKLYEGERRASQAAEKTWKAVAAKAAMRLGGAEADKEAEARADFLGAEYRTLLALNGTNRLPGVHDSERRLRYLIGLPATDGHLIRPCEPVSTAPIVFDWSAMLAGAINHRTDLRKQSVRVGQEELRLIAAENFLLPQLDLIGRYRLRGFGDDLTGAGPRFASASEDLFSFDHQEWEFGVEMKVVAGRRQAHAAVQHAKLQIERERAILVEQQRYVAHELSQAIAKVEVLQAGIRISGQRQQAAYERLNAVQAQYDIGKTDIHRLLNAQEDAIEAERQAIETTTDYAIALKDVAVANGTLLREHGVLLR